VLSEVLNKKSQTYKMNCVQQKDTTTVTPSHSEKSLTPTLRFLQLSYCQVEICKKGERGEKILAAAIE
jgi:hypothetical protein